MSVPDDETVLRRLPYLRDPFWVTDEVTGEQRISTAAFKVDADGISVYRLSLLRSDGLGAEAICTKPEHRVAALAVRAVRRTGCGVEDAPWPPHVPEPDHPRHRAHALITGVAGLPKGPRRARVAALVALAVLVDHE